MKFSIFAACAMAAAIASTAEARFGQEQGAASIISTLNGQITVSSQDSGTITTFQGNSIAPLLAAADPCALSDQMDKLVAFGKTLSAADSAKVITVARKAMHAEKNFNPFVTQKASVCTNAAKPASNELRGVMPLVDPSLAGAADANAKTTQNLNDIISGKVDGVAQAKGKSIAQQMQDVVGFSVIQNLAGGAASNSTTAATTAAAAPASTAAASAATASAAPATAAAATAASASASAAAAPAASGSASAAQLITELLTDLTQLKSALAGGASTASAAAATAASSTAASATTAAAASTTDAATTAAAGNSTLSLGQCTQPPTIKFGGGFQGRKATELTFLPQNEQEFPGQESALNPVIIVNFLCDRLNDKCHADAAHTKCEELKAQFQASGDRSGAVADTFNAAFGVKTNFAALGSNPKN